MNQICMNRCKCNEEFSITKKRKSNLKQGKPLQYPKSNEITSKTFQIKYEKISSTAKFILNNFFK
jgi:hypothetical protein